jgi:flavin reductase (DIM6/NTAB) family NADH-FMN oxidoreductase RutF
LITHTDQVGELGEISGKEYVEKLTAVGLTAVKGKETSQPLIQETSTVLESRTRERSRTGTHELIIAEVLGAYAADSFSNYWDFSQYKPFYCTPKPRRTERDLGYSCRLKERRGEYP